MDESPALPTHCPECRTPLTTSVLRSSRSEDLVLQCPICGYTALARGDLPRTLSRLLKDLFEQVGQLTPFNVYKVLKNPRATLPDKLIATVAKLATVVLDYKTLLVLVAFFSTLLGRRKLGIAVAAIVMACMVLHRDIVSQRLKERSGESETA